MKILIVDDDKQLRDKIVKYCKLEDDLTPYAAENGLSARRKLDEMPFDAVITDLDMPGLNGLELLRWIQAERPNLPVIMMSGYGQVPDAVEAMKRGAYDYVMKPFELETLIEQLRHVLDARRVQDQVETGAERADDFTKCIGESQAMQHIKALIAKIAPTPSTVLITGESGTGKEVIARLIHAHSPRADQPFVPVNIGGIPDTLLESELFGHEKGAFTGAVARKAGMFEIAHGGTLLLDEIGEMPVHLQVKLLRVLQEREIQPLGSTKTRPVDVRILAATNKVLADLIEAGAFREDLYYRLNILEIALPPLRERNADIPLLAGYFLNTFNARLGTRIQGIEQDAIAALQRYAFPGNVRELENIIERAMIFAKGDTLTTGDLGLDVEPARTPPKGGTLEEIQKAAIIEALQRWEGNRTRAAAELGINRKTLHNKIKEYGLRDV